MFTRQALIYCACGDTLLWHPQQVAFVRFYPGFDVRLLWRQSYASVFPVSNPQHRKVGLNTGAGSLRDGPEVVELVLP